MDSRITPEREKLLRLLAASPCNRIDCEAKELNEFSDMNSTLTHPDVINQCIDLGWARQRYNTSDDTGFIELTPKGVEALV